MISYDDRASHARVVRCKYINTAGMNSSEANLFEVIIEGAQSFGLDNLWYAGNCQVPGQTRCFNLAVGYAKDTFGPAIPKRYIHDHFFWSLPLLRTGEHVILDPTGVPIDFPRTREEIAPYFGLASEAPEPHKRIYARMEDMNNWGIREFPPGFHP